MAAPRPEKPAPMMRKPTSSAGRPDGLAVVISSPGGHSAPTLFTVPGYSSCPAGTCRDGVQPVDIDAVRAAFDAQIRRKAEANEPGAVIEADAGVLRWVAPGTQTSCIVWSQLDAGSADAAIAAQQAYFTARGTPVEWKYYDYDLPADLPQRLLAAGFEADDEELMLVAETAAISHEVVLPAGVRLEPVT